MRVRIYARVSSAAQRERETIAGQMRTLRAHAKARGWQVLGEHVDDGVSASSGHIDERHGLRAMLDQLAGVDAVLVLDADRLSRSEDLIERAAIMGTIQRAGVRIALVLTGDVHAADDLVLMFQGYAAADWVKKHRSRILQGKLEAIRRGGKPAGPTPYGLSYDRATKTWGIDEPRAKVVREVFARVAAGESIERVERELNDRGEPRPRGGLWTREAVWSMVRRETYKGRWLADKAKSLVVAVPPVVSEQLWAAANDRMSRPALRGIVRSRHVYLCERVARCAICGSRIVVLSPTPTRRAYYWCGQRRRPRAGERCTLPMFPVDQVDALLWAAVSARLARPDLVVQALSEQAQERPDGPTWQKDAEQAEKALARLERASAGALARHRRGLMTDLVLDAELAANTRDRQTYERQLAAARSQLSSIEAARTRVRDMAAALERLRREATDAPAERRREVIRALMDGAVHVVVLGPRALEVTAFARLGDQVEEHALAASSSSQRMKPLTLRVVVSQPGDACEPAKRGARRK